MPPARKDSQEGDELSRPSTSRAFSPSLAPPVKRSRASLGGVPPPPSTSSSSLASRRQSMGGRQARIEEFIDEKELQEGLLIAAMETADEMLMEDEENGMEKIEIDKEVISATARIVWDAMAEDWATDLVAFSRHAGRETIKDDDVKLMMRRNPKLLAEVLAECEGEEDGEGSTSMGTTKRKSTGAIQHGRPQKEPREDEDMEIMDIITPLRRASVTSMTSVVPETPHGIVPLAHSTPMNGRSVSMMMGRRGNADFSIPSPIQEDVEKKKGEGRKVNRSIMNDLSDTMIDASKEGVNTQEMDEDFFPMDVDLRHPREQEDEERRLREEGTGDSKLSQTYQLAGPSTRLQDYGRPDSPELFEEEETKKKVDYDSFDDDCVFEDEKNTNKARHDDMSQRMSESAAIREMLDDDEEERGRTVVIEKKKNDSFDDDDSIQFVQIKKEEKKATPPNRSIPSKSASNTNMVLSGLPAMSTVTTVPSTASSATVTRAAPVVSATSQRSSQDSFYNDEILDDPPPPQVSSIPATNPIVQSSPSPSTALIPIRRDDYDSFDDDDDDFVSPPNRSKENIPKAIEGHAPKNTVATRWSTVTIEEVVSPVAQKQSGNNRGVFAEDIFGLNDLPSTSKPSQINKPSTTVPTKPSPMISSRPSPTVSSRPSFAEDIFALNQPTTSKPSQINKPSTTAPTKPSPMISSRPSPTVSSRPSFAEDIFALNQPTTSKHSPINRPSPTVPIKPSPATVSQKPSPTVSSKPPPTVHQKAAAPQSTAKKTPMSKDVKGPSAGFSSFSFFGDESTEMKTPIVKREDSDFLDTSNRQSTSATKTPIRGRGGARGGRGFPRRVDPNSKTNRKIREQSTPVRLSPRPPSRISEVIDSFEDEDFDVSAFDD